MTEHKLSEGGTSECPLMSEDAINAYNRVEAYLEVLGAYMRNARFNHDGELRDARERLQAHAKSAIVAIVNHVL